MMGPRQSKLRSLRHVILSGFVLSWLGAFVATHVPLEQLPELGTSDKTLHLVGFGVLGAGFWLTMLAFGAARLRRVAVIIPALMTYGAIDEITQPLVHRYATLEDWLADVVGVIAAVVVLEALRWLAMTSRHLGQSRRRPSP